MGNPMKFTFDDDSAIVSLTGRTELDLPLVCQQQLLPSFSLVVFCVKYIWNKGYCWWTSGRTESCSTRWSQSQINQCKRKAAREVQHSLTVKLTVCVCRTRWLPFQLTRGALITSLLSLSAYSATQSQFYSFSTQFVLCGLRLTVPWSCSFVSRYFSLYSLSYYCRSAELLGRFI